MPKSLNPETPKPRNLELETPTPQSSRILVQGDLTILQQAFSIYNYDKEPSRKLLSNATVNLNPKP